MRRTFGLLALFLGATLCFATAQSTETLHLEGLQQPVEILKDAWGISHIYAQNEHDLFFAQGFNAARDRLLQLEIWRRQATGTVAEIQGPKALLRDIGARLLQYRGDMQTEMRHYHDNGETIIPAFVAGINAYIAETQRHPDLLPPEFAWLGITPQPWTPEIVVSRHNGLFRNVDAEILMAHLVGQTPPETLIDLLNLHPGIPDLNLDPKIEANLLSEEMLNLYHAPRSGVWFAPEDVQPEFRRVNTEDGAFLHLNEASPPAITDQKYRQDYIQKALKNEDVGSNNWVVSGDHSFSGFPLMANDPHRLIQAPSLRYWAHLNAPGWNVIGGGEPALPGISIGHNDHGAWGLTVFLVDQEDLYVYDTNPANPNQYQYRGQWADMEVITETFNVKDQGTVTHALKFTRHGPVLYEDPENHKAYALRAAWLEVGGAPYLASLRMDQATTWEEFREACTYSHTPSENMVWADREGNIGWQAVGITPLRPNWSGLLPVPGDGSYEWSGFLPIAELPHVTNPPQGWWATANQNNVPPHYPHEIGFMWSDPFRFARVSEVLASGRRFTMPDMMRLQTDEYSLPARALVPFLAPLSFNDERVQTARDMLLNWDHVLAATSIPAGIYALWEKNLIEEVGRYKIPDALQPVLPASFLSLKKVIEWITAPSADFGEDPLAGRDAAVHDSFVKTIADLTERFGANMDQWIYGQPAYKHAKMRHPLGGAVHETLRAQLETGPLPRGGNSYTVNNTAGLDNQIAGGSFRIITDTGNWDHTVGTNTPGQSGVIGHPFYANLFEIWATNQYFPVFFSREKIEGVTKERITLTPR